MTKYYDSLETQDPAEREQSLLQRLPEALKHAKENAPAIADQLKDIDVSQINTREALAQIPVMRKSDLLSIQLAHHTDRDSTNGSERLRAFGGFSTIGWGSALRVF